MPYPFAHPAAVLPLVRPMGRFAAPSALVIGSIVPDLWYFAPSVDRVASHSVAGLFWFCLPLGVASYVFFHLLLKQPLIALLSSRLAAFTSPALPPAPWYAVLVSVWVGALTHVAWDDLTHLAEYPNSYNFPQHISTALGSAILVWWVWRKLHRAPSGPPDARLSPRARTLTIAALATAAVCAAWLAASELPAAPDIAALRQALRSAASAAAIGLGLALFVYCAIWQLGKKR